MKLKVGKVPPSTHARALPEGNDAISGDLPQIVPRYDAVRSTTGRPRTGETWRDVLRKVGDVENVSGLTRRQMVADHVWEQACAGAPWAIMWLADREDGKPGQAITIDPGTQRNPMLDLDDEELAQVVALVRARRGVTP